MNILIIGNGFDIAHGLQTRYSDFLDFVNGLNDNKDSSAKHFDEIKQLSKDNIWITYFSTIAFKENWVDFEDEILQVIQRLNVLLAHCRKHFDILSPDYKKTELDAEVEFINDFCNNGHFDWKKMRNINDYLKLKKDLLDDLNGLIRCLELYLLHHVEERERCKPLKPLKDLSAGGGLVMFDGVLCFNYTDIFSKLYEVVNNNIVYVHGKAQEDGNETSIILGIDEYLDNETKNQDIECIEFKKYFQRIYKKTGNEYKQWIFDMNRNPTLGGNMHYVFIFGHSLGYTDREVLKEFFDVEYAKVIIFYHNEIAFKQYISNLVRIIGQDEVIRRVHGHNPTIIFEEQDLNIPIDMRRSYLI